jgi:hypothetical protein
MSIDQDLTQDPNEIIGRAASAAAKVLGRGGKKTFNGKTAREYATEAWLYHEERGMSHEYTSRRAKFLVIEDMRNWYGRNKERVKVEFKSPESLVFQSTTYHEEEYQEEINFDRIGHKDFGVICQCLYEGRTQTCAAKTLGVSSTRVRQIIDQEKWRLLRLLGMGN